MGEVAGEQIGNVEMLIEQKEDVRAFVQGASRAQRFDFQVGEGNIKLTYILDGCYNLKVNGMNRVNAFIVLKMCVLIETDLMLQRMPSLRCLKSGTS